MSLPRVGTTSPGEATWFPANGQDRTVTSNQQMSPVSTWARVAYHWDSARRRIASSGGVPDNGVKPVSVSVPGRIRFWWISATVTSTAVASGSGAPVWRAVRAAGGAEEGQDRKGTTQ